jgi:site-specific recombinase XerD
MRLRNVQYLLEVLVKYIQDGVGKSPQKEKRSNQNEGYKILSAHQWYSFLFHNMIIPDNRYKAIDNCGCKDKQNSRSLPNIFTFAIVQSCFFSTFTAVIQC